MVLFQCGFPRSVKNEGEAARGTLRLSVLQNNLATATISAYGREFEQSRQQATDFFTAFRAELDRENSAFNKEQHAAVLPILQQRDEIITILARSDAFTKCDTKRHETTYSNLLKTTCRPVNIDIY